MRALRIAAQEGGRAVRLAAAHPGGPLRAMLALGAAALVTALVTGAVIGDASPVAAPAPPPAPTGEVAGAYLVRHPDGSPYTFVCAEEIVVLLNPNRAPSQAEDDLRLAVAHLERGLGRTVTYGGVTHDDVDSLRRRHHPSPTILVAWVASPAELGRPGGHDTAGIGGPITERGAVVAGTVTLVASAGIAPGAGPGGRVALMMHELAHASNLDHSADPGDLMYPSLLADRTPGWGPGDLAGLRRLGACTPPLTSVA